MLFFFEIGQQRLVLDQRQFRHQECGRVRRIADRNPASFIELRRSNVSDARLNSADPLDEDLVRMLLSEFTTFWSCEREEHTSSLKKATVMAGARHFDELMGTTFQCETVSEVLLDIRCLDIEREECRKCRRDVGVQLKVRTVAERVYGGSEGDVGIEFVPRRALAQAEGSFRRGRSGWGGTLFGSELRAYLMKKLLDTFVPEPR